MKSAIKQIILNSPDTNLPNHIQVLVHTEWTDDHDPIRVLLEVKDDDERVAFFHQISKIVFDQFYKTTEIRGSLIAEPQND